ncbi:hypothetical protein [Paenibacillus taiwanensis]|uniref:hypothetical protein n=1 Tax=Paenibacillus taiwanensis TaxID=401638 RepID=UPI000407CFE9|nr:hypothetical protein [Paenibacillus taiwanensis]
MNKIIETALAAVLMFPSGKQVNHTTCYGKGTCHSDAADSLFLSYASGKGMLPH